MTPPSPTAETTALQTAALLRLEVALLRARHRHESFDTVVHVGELGGACQAVAVGRRDAAVLDPGTRTDLVAALLEPPDQSSEAVAVWLTRSGEPSVQDEDLSWLSAASRALAVHERVLAGFWSLTRHGWLDVRSGEARTWKRLRL